MPIALAIVLNVIVLGAGTIWLQRQTKRVAAERAAEHRSLFQLEPLPPAGEDVLILVENDDSRTSEIEGVHWPALGWTDALTLLKVEDEVLGWRHHPFRHQEPPEDDFTDWSWRQERTKNDLTLCHVRCRIIRLDDGIDLANRLKHRVPDRTSTAFKRAARMGGSYLDDKPYTDIADARNSTICKGHF